MSNDRYMVTDKMTLDDAVAHVQISYPNKLSADELADVEAWFALRVRAWKRWLVTPPADQPESGQ